MQQVISELQKLRDRGRIMLVTQRLAVLLAWVLGILLALIVLDYLLRLPGMLRLALLLAGVGTLVSGIAGYLRPAILFQPSLTQFALRVERVMPSVSGRLASAVEFASAGVDQSNPLAARSVRETQTRLAGQSIGSAMNHTRTWRDLGILLGVASVVIAITLVDPAFAGTGLKRLLLPYADTKWPARTGVDSMMSGVQVHPRGQALALRANVTRGPLDQRVEAHYRLTVDGKAQPWQNILLTHQDAGIHERLIDTTAERIEFYFSTDDDQSSSQTIEFVPSPAILRATLKVSPPAYTQGHIAAAEFELGPGTDDRAVTDSPSLAGSRAEFHLELNKPLPVPGGDQRAWLAKTLGWGDSPLPEFQVDSSNATAWTLRWTLGKTQSLTPHLVDEHGLSNSEPIAYRIEAADDRSPVVTITMPQADQSVLPTAVIGLETEGRDDVALASLGLQANVQSKGRTVDEALVATPDWQHGQTMDDATAKVQADLDLGPLHVSEGDVVLVSGVAKDAYEPSGAAESAAPGSHEVRSPVRRLRVISEMDFATQLRRQLSAVRQNAIRMEAQQAELQDDIAERGVQPGMNRAQAQLGERIAGQRNAVQDIEKMLQQNRLDDAQLAEILRQTHDLLDHAGRAANKAVEQIERRSKDPAAAPDDGKPDPTAGKSGNSPSQAPKPTSSNDKSPAGGQSSPQDAGQAAKTPSAQSQPGSDNEAKPTAAHEASPQDQPVVEAQQEVRDELADLIKLLDRDEDTWVVKRQLEDLLQQQAKLTERTETLGQRTMGQKAENLPEQERSELDRISQKQRDMADQARKLIEDMRERSQSLEKVDKQSSDAMRSAADTAEQQQLDREMENAAQKAQQNQMTSAKSSQEQAQSTMQKMLKDIAESKRAVAQQLIRQLGSLIESIQRLIAVQENQITALKLANDTKDYSPLDRPMIRLNQNTQSVAGEARAAGNDAKRIARSLDRAADTQGAAVVAFRAQPPDPVAAEDAENRSLELLKEAKGLAEELQKKTQEQEVQKRREELMAAYRKLVEQQVAVRGETLKLISPTPLDRRQLVEARRMGTEQDAIRTGLNDLKSVTSEIMDSPVFMHVHKSIDGWSVAVTESLVAGAVTIDITDRQQQIADSIGRLIQSLEETMAQPDEFAKDEQNQKDQQGGQQGQSPQPLIPPVAQLKLLQGLQEQVYNLTKELDGRGDLDEAQRRNRLRDIGQQQRDLMDLGKQMLEQLQSRQAPAPNSEGAKDQPDHKDPPAEPPAN